MHHDSGLRQTAKRLAALAASRQPEGDARRIEVETEVLTGKLLVQDCGLKVRLSDVGDLARAWVAIHTVIDRESRSILDVHVELLPPSREEKNGARHYVLTTRRLPFVPNSLLV